MELSAYLFPLRRWWWLLLASTLVAGISSFVATLQQPAIYQARTTLMIGRAIDDPNPTQGEFSLAQQLAQTYADIANREPVRHATMQALNLSRLPQYLARALPLTQLIEIAVTDVDPLRAQVVANELANQLMLRSPTGANPEDQERRQFIENQLNILQTQIEETQDEITGLQEQLGTLNSARQLQDTQTQIAAQETKLNTLQSNYAALLANTQEGATNTLAVVESAELPSQPIGPNKSVSILLSAAIGFSLAAGAAYLLEYLDDTLKTPEEVARSLGVPVLGLIADTGKDDHSNNNGAYVSKHPRSPIAESYRSLRANLEFAAVDKPLKTILIVSADTAAGKSSVAANLASVMAQGEKRVILVDADLRKPSIHTITDLPNESGLSDLFRNGVEITKTLKVWKDERVAVMTGGEMPPNPAELLGSRKMDHILARLGEKADVVVIDSPPLIVSDALMLATRVDGVLVVIRPGHTRKKFALAMMEQLNRAGARVLGIVMNRVPRGSAEHYGAFLYYSRYYDDGDYFSSDATKNAGIDERDEHQKEQAKQKVKGPKLNIRPGDPPSLNAASIMPALSRFRDKVRTAIKNRREPEDYPSVYLEEDEDDDLTPYLD
jgi:capsular exopolysaccharide synthesis family protein